MPLDHPRSLCCGRYCQDSQQKCRQLWRWWLINYERNTRRSRRSWTAARTKYWYTWRFPKRTDTQLNSTDPLEHLNAGIKRRTDAVERQPAR
ncbi:transposase [Pseudomonas aeruginosa]|uniref:transposase n=1 Tax=Pseudomonas aeruginosa TaxID=287 RepID=UPI00331330D2